MFLMFPKEGFKNYLENNLHSEKHKTTKNVRLETNSKREPSSSPQPSINIPLSISNCPYEVVIQAGVFKCNFDKDIVARDVSVNGVVLSSFAQEEIQNIDSKEYKVVTLPSSILKSGKNIIKHRKNLEVIEALDVKNGSKMHLYASLFEEIPVYIPFSMEVKNSKVRSHPKFGTLESYNERLMHYKHHDPKGVSDKFSLEVKYENGKSVELWVNVDIITGPKVRVDDPVFFSDPIGIEDLWTVHNESDAPVRNLKLEIWGEGFSLGALPEIYKNAGDCADGYIEAKSFCVFWLKFKPRFNAYIVHSAQVTVKYEGAAEGMLFPLSGFLRPSE